MNTLDQVKLLEQKVESAVEKIKQLQAENDALRSKCAELTNAVSSKSEQLKTFESDKHLIESGIQNALEHLNSIEYAILDKGVQDIPSFTTSDTSDNITINPHENSNLNNIDDSSVDNTTAFNPVEDMVSDSENESKEITSSMAIEPDSENKEYNSEIITDPVSLENKLESDFNESIFNHNFFGGDFIPASDKNTTDTTTSEPEIESKIDIPDFSQAFDSSIDSVSNTTFDTMKPLSDNSDSESDADSLDKNPFSDLLTDTPFGNNFGYALDDDEDSEDNGLDIF